MITDDKASDEKYQMIKHKIIDQNITIISGINRNRRKI